MSLKAINAYKKGTLKQDIINADPHKLTLMLMQGALDRLAYAKGCIERSDYQGRSEHLSKATAIFINLRDTLDLEVGGDFSENLYALYNYFLEKLSTISSENGADVISEVSELFLPIKDAWAQIPEAAKQQAYAQSGI
ncbi:flagellar export chaperone FliS [Glaciecola siphonariae]|uniref:Flagellar secretion chaperone FliS n=1 Tax=Glaciecola siphonariae TaxID=521012 RepID=A0ABV9LUS0_9ALTE